MHSSSPKSESALVKATQKTKTAKPILIGVTTHGSQLHTRYSEKGFLIGVQVGKPRSLKTDFGAQVSKMSMHAWSPLHPNPTVQFPSVNLLASSASCCLSLIGHNHLNLPQIPPYNFQVSTSLPLLLHAAFLSLAKTTLKFAPKPIHHSLQPISPLPLNSLHLQQLENHSAFSSKTLGASWLLSPDKAR